MNLIHEAWLIFFHCIRMEVEIHRYNRIITGLDTTKSLVSRFNPL